MEKTEAEAIITNELSLLDPAVRSDPARVGSLLHEEFEEVGKSGTRWTRADILIHLTTEGVSQTATATNFAASLLAPGVVLLTFETEIGGERARRASVWLLTDVGWKLRYHQGTPVPDK